MREWTTEELEREVKSHPERLPAHIAFIMDGNGRWAKRRNLPRLFGHREGVHSVRTMVEAGVEIGVKAMTFYTFSVENWKRPSREVSALMKLLVSTVRKEVEDLDENNVTLRTIGRIEDLPESPREELLSAQERLNNNNGLILTLALSYSGRQDIVRAVNRLLENGKRQIDEESLERELDTYGLPELDLLIRTSGENRISNFLLWQLAYSELYFSNRYWPEFRKHDLLQAIYEYQHRERRFGCISEQLAKT